MQIIETKVVAAQGRVRVEFLAEGGEEIAVVMRSDAPFDDNGAILRAKEMLVQLTAFDSDPDASRAPLEASDEIGTERD